jgi:hypothetical protein
MYVFCSWYLWWLTHLRCKVSMFVFKLITGEVMYVCFNVVCLWCLSLWSCILSYGICGSDSEFRIWRKCFPSNLCFELGTFYSIFVIFLMLSLNTDSMLSIIFCVFLTFACHILFKFLCIPHISHVFRAWRSSTIVKLWMLDNWTLGLPSTQHSFPLFFLNAHYFRLGISQDRDI